MTQNQNTSRCGVAARLALAALLATTFLTIPITATPTMAQEAGLRSYALPAQPLSAALVSFGKTSGLQIFFDERITTGLRSSAINGPLTHEAALARLLSGTGLEYRFANPRTVSIVAPAATQGAMAPDSSIDLGTIVIGGRSAYWDGTADTLYSTPGNIAVVTDSALQSYQITAPSDIFRATTGVLSGSSRTSGAIDANIHGLQGQGRVAMTVDGAENSALVYQGYQGIANRSFVDPDFISSIAIDKSADMAQGAIGGAVAVSTLKVDDVVKPGEKQGFRLKLSMSGNTTDEEYLRSSALKGNAFSGFTRGDSTKRPSLLNPTAGAASLSYGLKTDRMDLVLGYAVRNSGNYHAGSNGRYAVNMPDPTTGRFTNGGLSGYYDGEEVLNTSSDVRSGLAKATFRVSDALSWELGYSRYDTTFGEVMASRQATTLMAGIEGRLSNTDLETYTSRLRYNPEGNDLVDLSWNLWRTNLDSESAYNIQYINDSYLTSNVLWGTDISNTSRFATGLGNATLTVGASWKSEDTTPEAGSLIGRDGSREETGLFAKGSLEISDSVTVTGGLRYSHYSSHDRSNTALSRDFRVSDSAFSGALGVSWRTNDWLMLYANYQDARRLPSIFETVSYGASYYSPINPEHARNIDVGANVTLGDAIVQGDSLDIKLSYFDRNISDYIARQVYGNPFRMLFVNIDKARFQGFDLSSNWQSGGFTASLGATYYTGVEFCRTADSCSDQTLAADYANNHIPPKFQLTLDLSQKLLDDRLTVGGRVTRMGARAGGAEATVAGSSVLVNPIRWDPYTTVDLYTRYAVTDDVMVSFDVQNVTDTYYIDPLAQAVVPGPGRTARLSLDYRF